MRVKSIVLDGFKSYAHRRELADLSPHFNAITGLNGSGKSNIFDAICFVMGITNLKRMRADDPRELIYRAGTTGVHAARVTIEFINDDPDTAPPGYSCEEYPIITVGRQIKLGGKQQFFLNNTVSMQSRVKRFFESISLNVDNPHFMVLQGTVHKLIGMRSADMLSLIEEAVGTKAFDHRRRTAESLIKNKERKIQEIDGNIQTQIGPMLEAMKADQEAYRRFLQLTEGLEDKRRFRIAYQYYQKMEKVQSLESALARLRESIEQAKSQLQGIPAQEDQLTRRVMMLQDSLQGPNEATISLHEEEGAKKKDKGRLSSEATSANRRVLQLKAAQKELQKEKVQLERGADAFLVERAKREAVASTLAAKKEEVQKLQQSLQLLKSGIHAGSAGLSLEEERQQLDVKRIQLQGALGRHKEAMEDLGKEVRRLEARKERQSSALTSLQHTMQLAKTKYEEAERAYRTDVVPLLDQQTASQEKIKVLRQSVERAHEQFQRENGGKASFELSFDRHACGRLNGGGGVESHILGRVGELVVPTEEQYARALVVGAHQQLLRVVVDHDSVAEDIIHHGLRQRTSFLPLNKLQVPQQQEGAMARRVEEAKQLAKKLGGFACLAKDVVRIAYGETGTAEKHPHEAMLKLLADVVFGQFLVCSTLPIAEQLAYTQGIRLKAVTLDGEIAEPHGIMTGGSTANIRNLFAELQAFAQRKAPLQRAQAELQEEEERLRRCREQLRQHESTLQAFRLAEERWEVMQQEWQRAEGGGNVQQQLDDLRAQHQTQEEAAKEAEAELERVMARRQEVEAEAAVDVAAAQKELKKKLTAAQADVAKMVHEEEESAAAFERANAEAEERAATLHQRLQENAEELQQGMADLARCTAELQEVEKALRDIGDRLAQTASSLRQMEKSIEEAQEDLVHLQERKHSLETIVRNGDAEKSQLLKQKDEVQRALRDDGRRFPWLDGVLDQLGDPNGAYYFQNEERTQKTLNELAEAEAHTNVMSKRVGKKSTAVLYEDRKKEYDELVQQRQALGQDKEAIQSCIRGIEERKWHALDRMVTVVSSVFGKLFQTCLPGATAALVEERDEVGHLCGLGVRVVFNGKAKESLSELSGGQRSLLALCLLLAILRVRQAPIYILDEVDAALDPSHTQNIGLMLTTYFPNSQFLLVSLKDGMFSNANVLYHVRNTQGYSEITRGWGGGGNTEEEGGMSVSRVLSLHHAATVCVFFLFVFFLSTLIYRFSEERRAVVIMLDPTHREPCQTHTKRRDEEVIHYPPREKSGGLGGATGCLLLIVGLHYFYFIFISLSLSLSLCRSYLTPRWFFVTTIKFVTERDHSAYESPASQVCAASTFTSPLRMAERLTLADDASIICQEVLARHFIPENRYQHHRVPEIVSTITDQYIVHVAIIQKNGSGLYAISSCSWNPTSDACYVHKAENSAMICIVTVFFVVVVVVFYCYYCCGGGTGGSSRRNAFHSRFAPGRGGNGSHASIATSGGGTEELVVFFLRNVSDKSEKKKKRDNEEKTMIMWMRTCETHAAEGCLFL
eukprot:gene11863-8151_t